jgi:hypothetical protein
MITCENATELQKQSVEVRMIRKQLQEQRQQMELEKLNYTELRLMHVREQIAMLELRMKKELEVGPDGKELNQLAQAYGRLSEVEQKLAMRPSPGALKPVTPKQSRSQASEPTPLEE